MDKKNLFSRIIAHLFVAVVFICLTSILGALTFKLVRFLIGF